MEGVEISKLESSTEEVVKPTSVKMKKTIKENDGDLTSKPRRNTEDKKKQAKLKIIPKESKRDELKIEQKCDSVQKKDDNENILRKSKDQTTKSMKREEEKQSEKKEKSQIDEAHKCEEAGDITSSSTIKKLPEVPKTQKETHQHPKAKKRSNKTSRTTKNNEVEKGQATLTQYFQVRRSERKPKGVAEKERRLALEKKILSREEDGLEIRILKDKGRGVFPKVPFKHGDLVCEYAGDLISFEEAQQREKQYAENPEIGCYMYYFAYAGKKQCVDATKESGRVGRLLNHSKTNANVCTRLFPINNSPHLILVAARDINVDEELLYDYGERNKSAIDSHPWLKT